MPHPQDRSPRPSPADERRVLKAYHEAFAAGNRTVLVEVQADRRVPTARHTHVVVLAKVADVS